MFNVVFVGCQPFNSNTVLNRYRIYLRQGCPCPSGHPTPSPTHHMTFLSGAVLGEIVPETGVVGRGPSGELSGKSGVECGAVLPNDSALVSMFFSLFSTKSFLG